MGSGLPGTAGVWEAWASLSSCLPSHQGTQPLFGLTGTKPFSYPVIYFHLLTTGWLTWSSELYFLPPLKRFSSFLLQGTGGYSGAIIKIIVHLRQPRAEPSQRIVAFWLLSNQYHSFKVTMLVGHRDRIQIHYPSALDLCHLCGASRKSFVI